MPANRRRTVDHRGGPGARGSCRAVHADGPELESRDRRACRTSVPRRPRDLIGAEHKPVGHLPATRRAPELRQVSAMSRGGAPSSCIARFIAVSSMPATHDLEAMPALSNAARLWRSGMRISKDRHGREISGRGQERSFPAPRQQVQGPRGQRTERQILRTDPWISLVETAQAISAKAVHGSEQGEFNAQSGRLQPLCVNLRPLWDNLCRLSRKAAMRLK